MGSGRGGRQRVARAEEEIMFTGKLVYRLGVVPLAGLGLKLAYC